MVNKPLKESIFEQLTILLKSTAPEKIMFVGVGNRLRGDDAAGPLLINRIDKKTKYSCINAEGGLENYWGKVVTLQPEIVFIIDAVMLNKQPGEFALFSPEELFHTVSSTHDISLKMLLDLISRTNAITTFILGIQPFQIKMGIPISRDVEKAVAHLAQLIIDTV